MGRLRCTREEAEAEAIRIATEFVAASPYANLHVLFSAYPDNSSPKGASGKIPAAWIVAFRGIIPGVTVDGGEVFVRVNVQEKTAEFREF